MLFRGQNILGYRPYADDVVEYFVQKSIANGIDIIRIFDCLNDLRNLQTAVKAANKEKGHAQVALSYTLGDAYTLDYWKDMAKAYRGYGCKLHLYQGYGWSACFRTRQQSWYTALKEYCQAFRSSCIHTIPPVLLP